MSSCTVVWQKHSCHSFFNSRSTGGNVNTVFFWRWWWWWLAPKCIWHIYQYIRRWKRYIFVFNIVFETDRRLYQKWVYFLKSALLPAYQLFCFVSDITSLLSGFEAQLTGQCKRVHTDEEDILEDAIAIYKDPKFDASRPIRVTFSKQPAVDTGGPRREFYSIIYTKLAEGSMQLFEGPPTRLIPTYSSRIVFFWSYEMHWEDDSTLHCTMCSWDIKAVPSLLLVSSAWRCWQSNILCWNLRYLWRWSGRMC